jgi:hypothetical protein
LPVSESRFLGFGRVLEMPYAPPFPLAAPSQLKPFDKSIPNKTANEIDWFMTAEQEASSDQLRFKVCFLLHAS